MANKTKTKRTPNRGGRKVSLMPSSPKAGVTMHRSRYSCGGKLKK